MRILQAATYDDVVNNGLIALSASPTVDDQPTYHIWIFDSSGVSGLLISSDNVALSNCLSCSA